MSVVKRLKMFLDIEAVKYTTCTHSKAYTAQEIAASSHVSGKTFAKTVVVKTGSELMLVVLPAAARISLKSLATQLSVDPVEIATEDEFRQLFLDCETGAMPPFGNLYNLKTIIARELAACDHLSFNAGNHVEIVHLAMDDYLRLVKPRVLDFELD